MLIALVPLIPLGIVLSAWLQPPNDVWPHLVETLLPELVANTTWLALGVGVGTSLLGVGLAWLTAIHQFPGRRFFRWALMLPLAMPAYVMAFAIVGLLEFTGPIQTLLREWFGSSAGFPRIRSRSGVILVMSFALYPYVYLLALNAFQSQGRRALEAAQSLGLSRTQGFFKVALPMARPWIIAGVMLAMMETLADFGTVSIFNYDTFTTAIYKAWFQMFSLPAATQLASLLVMVVLALAVAEQHARGHRRYTPAGRTTQQQRIPLLGWQAWGATLACSLVLALAFIVPAMQLVWWAMGIIQHDLDARYIDFVLHSILLAAFAALLVATCALALSYTQRRLPDRTSHWVSRLATLGYAIPGSVLAVGIFVPIAWLDNQLLAYGKAWLPNGTHQILNGTLTVVLLAYLARFMAVGVSPVESAMHRITPSQDEAARSLGLGGLQLIRRVHLPQLNAGLLSAMLLVFVDVMKEMPITLMTRPFGWDTLAIRVFEMTSEGEWQRAALPAISLVIAGLLPVLLLMRQTDQSTSDVSN
ncbi:iron(III) transport system permease protein [Chitinivorax tropicus]|uniref:Iron(III) transport system permease protein n=1 Tax=Chitinivorax tropicus TaxID=714531 RepID=A0A840MSX4_9PROT|nr:iron ABC transporter permease [Chitinivorax tropicus]MBB5020189.1 iron(III) transport system permease protein [Chitinivorax tropicus]